MKRTLFLGLALTVSWTLASGAHGMRADDAPAVDLHGFDALAEGEEVADAYAGYAYSRDVTAICDPAINLPGYPLTSFPCGVHSATTGYAEILVDSGKPVLSFEGVFASPLEAAVIRGYDASGALVVEDRGCVTEYGATKVCGVASDVPLAWITISGAAGFWVMDSLAFASTPAIPRASLEAADDAPVAAAIAEARETVEGIAGETVSVPEVPLDLEAVVETLPPLPELPPLV